MTPVEKLLREAWKLNHQANLKILETLERDKNPEAHSPAKLSASQAIRLTTESALKIQDAKAQLPAHKF